MAFGKAPKPEEVARARAKFGLTQKQAAELVYVAVRTWENWEQGQRAMPAGLWELFHLKSSGKNS